VKLGVVGAGVRQDCLGRAGKWRSWAAGRGLFEEATQMQHGILGLPRGIVRAQNTDLAMRKICIFVAGVGTNSERASEQLSLSRNQLD
jgi:hypothetical protein